MGLITDNNDGNASDLEKILQSIRTLANDGIEYCLPNKPEDNARFSPAYVLPLELINNINYGCLIMDGKPVRVPIGFLRKKDYASKSYYAFDKNLAIWISDQPTDGVLYLPLKLINLAVSVGKNQDAKFIPDEGSPFQVYGVEGSRGLLPLQILADNEKHIAQVGFYQKKDESIGVFSNQFPNGDDKGYLLLSNLIREGKSGIVLPSGQKTMTASAQAAPGQTQMADASLDAKANGEIDWEEPKTIVSYLDQFIIGQNEAKMTVAVAFSNYMLKVRTKNDDLPKGNMLLIGPSGVGKTYMISLLAKKASLPMVQTKLTGKSSEGFKGENLSTVFEQMRGLTNGEAPYGVIFFDEIDKLADYNWASGSSFGPKIQDELISWLEEATVLADDNPQRKKYEGLNTKNILFVTAGAFQSSGKDTSLEGIVRKRLSKGQSQIGFGATQPLKQENEEYLLLKVRPEDLIEYGLKTELVGRLPSLGVLKPLTIGDKVRILTAAKRSPLNNYAQMLSLKGYKTEIDPAVPEIIAQHCPPETGARALNAVCNDLFTEIMYDPKSYADENKVIRVTPDLAKQLINLYA